MKDKNGINVECQNCASVNFCKDSLSCVQCPCQNGAFLPSVEAYEARIAELQEHNDILQKRVAELSMELLDQNMRDNKDVLERLKEYEENFDKKYINAKGRKRGEMNKCCMELFELMISKFREEMRGTLTGNGDERWATFITITHGRAFHGGF